MKFDVPLVPGKLLRRYKRFFADVMLDSGEQVVAHCPNTGSMRECLVEGGNCWLSPSHNPKRKLAWTLELVTTTNGGIAGINTNRANHLVAEYISRAEDAQFQFDSLQREVRFGDEKSRLDFCGTRGQLATYIEVKNVTLADASEQGWFPDAVTTRGAKHLRELMRAVAQGSDAMLLFCVQHSAVRSVRPAAHIDPLYAKTLQQAVAEGVQVVALGAQLSAREILLNHRLPVVLD